jgi:hypothetical protein
MRRLIIAAVGLALVVGIVVGGMVGNPFNGKASASTAAVGGRLIELGTIQVPPETTVEYSMVDVRDCAALYAMFRALDDLGGSGLTTPSTYPSSPDGTTRAGAVDLDLHEHPFYDGVSTVSARVKMGAPHIQPAVRNNSPTITTNATGWLWCATSPSYAVGGIAELPPLASVPGGSGMGGTTYAVLAGAAAGVLAFAVLAGLSVKKRGAR